MTIGKNKNVSKKINVENKLCKIINSANLTTEELKEIIHEFLFSIGASLENCNKDLTAEEVLERYANKPTYGNALMTQALWMKETWTGKET
jgi:hypothetical protein